MRFQLLWVFLFVTLVSCKKKDTKRRNENEKYEAIPNICNSDRESQIMCNCDEQELNKAKLARCWILEPHANEKVILPWTQFSSQTNLESLEVVVRIRGQLHEIPTEVLESARKMKTISIQYGTIHDINAYAFANASRLFEIKLARNNISNLQLHAFAHLQTLESVVLEDNSITELLPMVFHHVPNLRKLYLSRNNLTIIHDNAFRFTNHLHELELNSNSISILTRESFNGLFHLQRLDLTSNRLSMIGDLTFAEMPELKELELDRNAIEYISDRAFSGLKTLTRLRMAENKLKILGEQLFIENENIHFLDLRDNSMRYLKFNTLQPLWENFKNHSTHLLIDGNEFPCDCHLSWAYNLRNETSNTDVREVLEQLTCVLDEELAKDEPHSEEQHDEQFADNGVEYDDSVEYIDLPEDEGPPRKKVFDIPLEKLTCPEPLEAPTEASNSYEFPAWSSTRSSSSHLRITLFAVFFIGFKTAYQIFFT